MVLLVVIALVLAVVVKAFFLQAFYIPSASMNDTLVKDDRILVQKVSYWGSGGPHRGDVVVFADPGGWLGPAESRPPSGLAARGLEKLGLYPTGGHLVKRVIGVGGDEVRCCDEQGRMTVNGVALNEGAYLAPGVKPSLITFDVKVSPGYVWVQGDNRADSADSRVHLGDPGGGQVPTDDLVGKVFAVVWPLRHATTLSHARHLPRGPVDVMTTHPRGLTVRRDAGLYGYERALRRAGLDPIAGVDEAGRGACAGPLVAAAVILPDGRRGQVPGLADSKLLTPRARERAYAEVVRRALAWSVVVVEPGECDRLGMHVANVEALRRSLARLEVRPSYVLTDGFPVDGLEVPGLAMWKGDRVAACISAASVVAKVTRDRIMGRLHEDYPAYDFVTHKGYITPTHATALERHGPCAVHRRRFVNVRRALGEPVAGYVDPVGDDGAYGDAVHDDGAGTGGGDVAGPPAPVAPEHVEVGR